MGWRVLVLEDFDLARAFRLVLARAGQIVLVAGGYVASYLVRNDRAHQR